MALHNKKVLSDVEFVLTSQGGIEKVHRGAFLICDGGYHLWRIFQAPIKCAWTDEECLWSCRLESIRKDVECTFGIMKKRFQILTHSVLYDNRVKVDHTFISCCIHHNVLVEHDGMDRSWLDETNWICSREEVDEDILSVQKARAAARIGVQTGGTSFFSSSRHNSTEEVDTEVQSTCHALQAALVSNFWHTKHTVGWTKRRRYK
jgi:hypothetical protein